MNAYRENWNYSCVVYFTPYCYVGLSACWCWCCWWAGWPSQSARATHRKSYFTGGGLKRELHSQQYIQFNTKFAKSCVESKAY